MSEAYRPSSITRYINCNLWRFLPKEEKTPEQEAYLAERSQDHERLEQEKFSDTETECSAYFFIVKERSYYLFKENLLSMEIAETVFQGTPDVYAYDEQRKTLHILDYKTGRSYVKAKNNDQLLAYAMLAMDNHPDWHVEKYDLAILNTHHDSVDRWIFRGKGPVLDLKSRIEKAINANQDDSTFGDRDTDQLIYEFKKRQQEIFSREREVKFGAVSELLTPLLAERSKRVWKESIPEKFLSLQPMTITRAEEKFSAKEIEPYIEKTTYTVFKKPV